ncbi:DedA family protein [Fibrobacter sp. UWB3]|uniref:DedA family protein n=1 Tax=Fibrobacter sp. UWB3 TaxID=1964357 RepID=UPI000B522152|nr:DedA family protein [Fibrobacter sp. UWB3]OWV18544.1 alkaline phosphatase [Fibrobacter sp. UWB3]
MKNTAFKTTIALALLFTAFTFAADIVSVDAASAVTSTTADTAKSTGIYNQIIDWYNDNLNYGTITLLMAIESSFIPFPSELVVPPAAYKALQPGSGLNIALIVFFATLGALIGAYINYYLAKILGRPIIYKFADSRLGHFLLLDVEKVEKAENYFREHGAISTFVGRLITVIRQLISIPAGLAKMKLAPFTLYTFLGAAIWNCVLALLGYFAHGQKDIIEKYNSELAIALLGFGVLFIGYMVWNAMKPKKKQ